MTTLKLPQTDKERMQVLSTIYVKGLSTPKDELAFSANMLVYLKPFISKLSTELTSTDTSAASLSLIRQVVDELIKDILEEVEAACLRMGGKSGAHLASEYGLNFVFNPFEADHFYSQKVA